MKMERVVVPHARRPHQKRAVSDVVAGFRVYDRGQLIMACGTGKTVVSLWVKEDLNAQVTLVLVPSIALVDQFAKEWARNRSAQVPYAALCVCSDHTIGQPGEDDYDGMRFTTEDLRHDGFDVTSSAERIAGFLRTPGQKVLFSTYQSSHLVAEAQLMDGVPEFDLAIADEAHRCAGEQGKPFATILDGEACGLCHQLINVCIGGRGQESLRVNFIENLLPS